MSDVPTATKIAALEEHVRQLTADAAAFSSILKRGQEWMNSAHDSWQRMCNQREEAREALTKALADNATLNTAKDRLIDERNACLRELDAARHALDDRNAYAERLLAENVRLSNEAAFMRGFINNEDVRSDFQTVTAMRQALDRERERVLEWNVLVAQGCTPGGSEFHDCPQNVAYYIKERLADKDRIMKSQQKELNKERERCGVLEAEVKAWHAAEHLRKDEPHNEFMRLAEARFRTRETHALDAAKFGKEQNDG